MTSVLVVNAGSSSLKLRVLAAALGAAVRTLVIAAREDIEIARQTRAVLAGN